ncbi:MAG: aspartate aminotransferase family protein [Actinobacteria bacterium]|nr:aspartate aminotransferase family protein [Actinomycetota bacterium]
MSGIIEQYEKYVMPTYGRQQVAFVRGNGCYLYDEEGDAYLDFASGLSINNLGHCHPAVVKAAQAQLAELIHTCNLYYTKPGGELAQRISELSLGGKIFFSNSGAEANECAIKLARKYGHDFAAAAGDGIAIGDKHRIITLEESFHGRTMATLSATGQPSKQGPFKPLLPGFIYVPRNDISALKSVFDGGVCAVILELVLGESGVYPLDQEYVEAARKLADEHHALLIFDEVQSGLGRTGELFAYEHYGIKPDVMTLAKSLGGALPIGATVATQEYSDVLGPGMHGSTFGGGPVPCAAGLAVLNELTAPDFLTSVQAKGDYMHSLLDKLKAEGLVSEVRGLGLMLAIDLHEPKAAAVVAAALEQKIILNNTSENTVRFLPPLVVEEGMIEQVVEFLQTALSS